MLHEPQVTLPDCDDEQDARPGMGTHEGAAHVACEAEGCTPCPRPGQSNKVKGKAIAVPKRWRRPKLKPLAFGRVYCELCRETIRAGQPVAWVRVDGLR